MRTKIIAGIVLLSVIIGEYACDSNVVQPAGLPATCDTTGITYTNTMQTLIILNCGSMNTSCHSPGASSHRGDFSNYESLKRYATGGENSLYWRYLFRLNKMPLFPYLPLDACTSAKFKQWLLNGAPQ